MIMKRTHNIFINILGIKYLHIIVITQIMNVNLKSTNYIYTLSANFRNIPIIPSRDKATSVCTICATCGTNIKYIYTKYLVHDFKPMHKAKFNFLDNFTPKIFISTIQ